MRTDYYIDFRYLPKGAARPLGQGETVLMSSEGNFAMLPAVRDYGDSHVNCTAKIVVEEDDEDWGKLEKQ